MIIYYIILYFIYKFENNKLLINIINKWMNMIIRDINNKENIYKINFFNNLLFFILII